ncbi:MAG: sigma 54-interacting transcriptional regulator [Polyangiaceae bacterium]|nr:sigma 54-interacting transcriptional regulator [Polyangiaceae bacterium]
MSTTLQETEDPSTHVLGGEARGFCLLVAHHSSPERVGLRFEVPWDEPVLLGRDEGFLGPGGLADGRVSRRHARIVARRPARLTLEDLGSSNGTFVNGARHERAVSLQPYDIVRLGSILLLALRDEPGAARRAHPTLLGGSAAMAAVIEAIERVAPHRTTALILGETGTGKELAARAVHDASGRRGPFCPVNCAGLADTLVEGELFGHERGAFSGADRARPGLCEAASGGTLFIDEIGDASPTAQRSLLRFLQEGEVRRVGSTRPIRVDVRVIAATHRDLRDRSRFREDLYARLARAIIHLPPLRERAEDIPLLLRHFLAKYGAPDRPVDWRVTFAMLRHRWPRNVRELEGFVERAIIEASGDRGITLTPPLARLLSSPEPEDAQAPDRGGADAEASDAREERGRRREHRPSAGDLEALLRRFDGNITALAAHLGAGRNTVYRWLKAANIDLAGYRTE